MWGTWNSYFFFSLILIQPYKEGTQQTIISQRNSLSLPSKRTHPKWISPLVNFFFFPLRSLLKKTGPLELIHSVVPLSLGYFPQYTLLDHSRRNPTVHNNWLFIVLFISRKCFVSWLKMVVCPRTFYWIFESSLMSGTVVELISDHSGTYLLSHWTWTWRLNTFATLVCVYNNIRWLQQY